MGLPTISGEFGVYSTELREAANGNKWIKIRGGAAKEERDQTGAKVDGPITFLWIIGFVGAEHLYESISKGDGIVVTGVLEQRKWTDRKTNKQMEEFTIIADSLAVSTRNQTARTMTRIQQDEKAEAEAPAAQEAMFGSEQQ